jgi:hypothetical protein
VLAVTFASRISDMSVPEFALAVALAALLAMAVFHHASKRGNTHATAWGVATFLAAGVAVPVYFIRYYWHRGKQRP